MRRAIHFTLLVEHQSLVNRDRLIRSLPSLLPPPYPPSARPPSYPAERPPQPATHRGSNGGGILSRAFGIPLKAAAGRAAVGGGGGGEGGGIGRGARRCGTANLPLISALGGRRSAADNGCRLRTSTTQHNDRRHTHCHWVRAVRLQMCPIIIDWSIFLIFMMLLASWLCTCYLLWFTTRLDSWRVLWC